MDVILFSLVDMSIRLRVSYQSKYHSRLAILYSSLHGSPFWFSLMPPCFNWLVSRMPASAMIIRRRGRSSG
ncbi:hypothetical protein D3C84_874360 [compost metagenome]